MLKCFAEELWTGASIRWDAWGAHTLLFLTVCLLPRLLNGSSCWEQAPGQSLTGSATARKPGSAEQESSASAQAAAGAVIGFKLRETEQRAQGKCSGADRQEERDRRKLKDRIGLAGAKRPFQPAQKIGTVPIGC